MNGAATYSESAKGVRISRERALRELAKHGCHDLDSVRDFDSALGNRPVYVASDVLAWLGY